MLFLAISEPFHGLPSRQAFSGLPGRLGLSGLLIAKANLAFAFFPGRIRLSHSRPGNGNGATFAKFQR